MPYVPNIQDYKPFYIQAATDATAWDTRDYGLVAQTQPYPDNIEIKEPYKNEWFDENGDDEYVSETYVKPMEIEVKFYIKTLAATNTAPIDTLNTQKANFRAKIKSGYFKIYDSWQKIGFQKVRFVRDSVEQRDIDNNTAWMIFSVTFKVDDPVTRMSLNVTESDVEILPVVEEEDEEE